MIQRSQDQEPFLFWARLKQSTSNFVKCWPSVFEAFTMLSHCDECRTVTRSLNPSECEVLYLPPRRHSAGCLLLLPSSSVAWGNSGLARWGLIFIGNISWRNLSGRNYFTIALNNTPRNCFLIFITQKNFLWVEEMCAQRNCYTLQFFIYWVRHLWIIPSVRITFRFLLHIWHILFIVLEKSQSSTLPLI